MIKVGSQVRLKGGHTVMTVNTIYNDSAECVWETGNVDYFQHRTFGIEALECLDKPNLEDIKVPLKKRGSDYALPASKRKRK